MNICIICAEYPPGPIGGIGVFTQGAARWLVQHGHKVKVIGVYTADYPSAEKENDMGVEVYRIPLKPGKFGWVTAWRKQYKQIKQWIENKEVDIVEAPDSRGWFAFWGKMDAPLIIRSHGTETSFASLLGMPANRFTAFMEKQSYHRADAYCAVAAYVARHHEKLFNLPQKHTVIYNSLPVAGVTTDNTPREKDLVVYSGTLIAKKGIISLIKASLLLHERGITHRVVMNGKDSIDKELGSIKAYVEALIPANLKSYYIFNGHQTREKLFDYYRRAMVAVFPSFVEAFAIAPMEAMLYGCPTIYTKRVSGPELITDGIDGLLVEPSDINELADAVQRILQNPEQAAAIGEAGRQRIISTFDTEKIMPQNVRFYEEVIRNFHSK